MFSQKSGYRLPAEWEPHAATWVAWPHRRASFLGNFDEVPVAFSKLVRLLARYEPVRVIGSEAVLRDASFQLQESSRVDFIERHAAKALPQTLQARGLTERLCLS